MDTVPANRETDLSHCSSQSLLCYVLFCYGHSDALVISLIIYIFNICKKLHRIKFECKISFWGYKFNHIIYLRAISGGWQKMNSLFTVNIPWYFFTDWDWWHRSTWHEIAQRVFKELFEMERITEDVRLRAYFNQQPITRTWWSVNQLEAIFRY